MSNHLLAAAVLTGAVLLLARGLAASFSGGFPDLGARFRPALPVLGAMSILLYVLAIALHYALVAVQSSRKRTGGLGFERPQRENLSSRPKAFSEPVDQVELCK